MVVPHRAVEILRSGSQPVVASAVHGVLYNAHQEYQRRLVDPRGDDCTYFALRPPLLAEIVTTELGMTDVDPLAPFQHAGAILSAQCYARYQAILGRLVAGPFDPDAALEPVLDLVGAIVRGSHANPASLRPNVGSTAARHRALAHEVLRLLGERFAEPLRLEDIAAQLGASPYHTARVFRAHVGHTIHEHRIRTRINVAIRRLADPRTPLTRLALELGFSSHSHFCDQFRRRVGWTPSRWRTACARNATARARS